MMNKIQGERYSRTLSLVEIGEEGQEKLLKSKVFIVGVGGLGSQLLLHLSALGVGKIGVADVDNVSLSNLPRQVLYDEDDVNKNKIDVACSKINKKNSDVKINKYNLLVNKDNAKELFKDYDIVIDASDNFQTKFIVEDACLQLGKPFIIAGVSGFQGQVILTDKNSKFSFKSLFDEIPHHIEEKYVLADKPVFPLAVSLVSDVTSSILVKYILDIGESLLDTLVVVDANNIEIKKYRFE